MLDEVVAAMAKRLRDLWDLRPKIYVAQLRNDELKACWDDLKEQLHVEGYSILPRGVLPVRVPDGRIREWLESARLSVHLEGVSDDPLVQRQLAIAKQSGRPLVVLREAPAPDQLPAVVAEVQERIEAARKPAVYLIYDYYSDHVRVAEAGLPELIRLKTGCEVFLPEAGEKYHKFRLQVSDGVLLFRSDAPREWLKSQEQALLQAAARRATQRVPRPTAEARYFTRRPNGDAAGVRVTQGPRQEWIIERTGQPQIDDLQPFFEALQAKVSAVGGPG
jgi:hypothetical protein